MTGRPSVTVVVPSRERPHLVPGVLDALRYLTYPAFEIILVGDQAAIDAYDVPEEIAAAVHYFPCDAANISTARNIGIRAARGEIVAFIDDDSIPEPDWLDRLVEPFRDPKVGAAGGRVRDRDGVRLQFDGGWCDLTAEETPFDAGEAGPKTASFCGGRMLALMGTNCAFRRAALLEIGGFDESYHYYLDETDALIRLGQAGWLTAWVPEAEVHHFCDRNPTRGRNREPRDPYQLGASKAYFCETHAPAPARSAALDRFRCRVERDLDTHIRLGRITGAERKFVLNRLEQGFWDGALRRAALPLFADDRQRVILPYAARLGEKCLSFAVLSGNGVAGAVRMDRIAQAIQAIGHRVTLIRPKSAKQSPSVRFADGIWVHETGSMDGEAATQRLAGLMGSRKGYAEAARIGDRRRFDAMIRPYCWDQMIDVVAWHPIALEDARMKISFSLSPRLATGDEQACEHVRAEINRAFTLMSAGKAADARSVMPFPHRASATVSPG
ncbi:MAG: glycosyltransferase [Pseudomonadota bacterium]